MKKILVSIYIPLFVLAIQAWGKPLEMMRPEQVTIGGYLGDRMDSCYENWVKKLDPDYLVDPFRKQNETRGWQTEFWGKWMLGAVPMACYANDEAMKTKIAASVKSLIATQSPDGYIGNYTK